MEICAMLMYILQQPTTIHCINYCSSFSYGQNMYNIDRRVDPDHPRVTWAVWEPVTEMQETNQSNLTSSVVTMRGDTVYSEIISPYQSVTTSRPTLSVPLNNTTSQRKHILNVHKITLNCIKT